MMAVETVHLNKVNDEELTALAALLATTAPEHLPVDYTPDQRLVSFLEAKYSYCLELKRALWAIYADDEPLPCGYVALYDDKVEDITYELLDLWVVPTAWEDGTAYLAAKEALRVAVEVFDLHCLAMLLDRHDEHAIPIAVRLGMYFYYDVTYRGRLLQLYQYVRPLPCRAYGTLSAHFYDIKAPHATRSEIAFHEKRLQAIDGPVLEAMCGSGRLLIPLLQKGFQVEGIDNAPAMLARCRQRCQELGLAEPILYEQEIQQLQLPKHYAAIIVALGSIHLLAGRQEVIQTLKRLRAHLAVGGLLIVDTFLPMWSIVNYRKPVIIAHQIDVPDGVLTCDSRVAVNLPKQFLTSRKLYRKTVAGQVVCEEIEDMTVHWYYRFEIEEMLQQAGFAVTAIHDRPYQEFAFSHTYEAHAI